MLRTRKVRAADLTAAFRVYIPPGARMKTTANPDGTFTVRMPVASYYHTHLNNDARRRKFIADITGLLGRRVEGARVESITYRIGRKSVLGQAVFATVTVALMRGPLLVLVCALIATASLLIARGTLFPSGPATAQVTSKDMNYQNGAWVYYLVLSGGQRERARYGTWNAAQPGRSTATITTAEDEDPEVTDPETQYTISQSAVSTAASQAKTSLPEEDESFPVEDEEP